MKDIEEMLCNMKPWKAKLIIMVALTAAMFLFGFLVEISS